MGRQPMLGRPTNPATNRAEDAILKAYRDGLTAGSGKAKGDRVERTPPPPKEALQPRQGKNAEFWNCQHCQEPNLPIHRWCYCCREPRHGAWSKGSGKGAAAAKSAPKNASPKEPVIVIQEVEATPVQTAIEAERTALGKTLATMGLVPAPPVDQLKPYPRPKGRTVDGEGKGKALALAQDKVRSLQASLDTAKLQHPTSVIEAFTKELAAAKAEEAKLSKVTTSQTAKDAIRNQLETRVQKADEAASSAAERHQLQLEAIDSQVERLKEIRACKILDFKECQIAFAERHVQDKIRLQEYVDVIGQLIGSGEGTATTETVDTAAAMSVDLGSTVVKDAADLDIRRHFSVRPTFPRVHPQQVGLLSRKCLLYGITMLQHMLRIHSQRYQRSRSRTWG